MCTGFRLKRAKIRPEKVLDTRLARRELIEAPEPLTLHAVVDEAVLRREIGGPDVLREQLAHLLVMAARPNITLQAMPFTTGSYGSMNGPMIIVDYPEPGSTPGVYLEYPGDGAWVENPDDVQSFTTMFDDIAKQALGPTDTTNLIHERLKQLADR